MPRCEPSVRDRTGRPNSPNRVGAPNGQYSQCTPFQGTISRTLVYTKRLPSFAECLPATDWPSYQIVRQRPVSRPRLLANQSKNIRLRPKTVPFVAKVCFQANMVQGLGHVMCRMP